MKFRLRLLILIALIVAIVGDVHAASGGGDPTFMDKMKDFFAGPPPPAPSKKKKKTTSTKKRHSPTPSPHATASRKPKASPSPTQTPTATPEESKTPSAAPSQTPALSPAPEISPTASPSFETSEISVSPAASASPSPSLTSTPSSEPSLSSSPRPTPKGTSSPAPSPPAQKKRPATTTVSLSPAEVSGYEKYPPEVRKLLDLALDLTTQNLGYKYGSADPSKGGMDCSGFIYYVLSKSGFKDPPRDAREQYIWVRKAGKFQAVLGRSQDTFELDALKPGDLLFWVGTYNVDRDPAITHTMIYLGREKATNQRVMVGASDGRTYKGQSRFGVSVFDFKVAGRKASSESESGPIFVGYASIPGLDGG